MKIPPLIWACAALCLGAGEACRAADDLTGVADQLQRLRQQNEQLQQQLRQQQDLIEQLNQKLARVEAAQQGSSNQLDALKASLAPAPSASGAALGSPLKFGAVTLSGEAGVAIFHQASEGEFNHADLRVDEAKLFVDANVWQDVYFYSEINLITREASDENLHLGELYVDFENVSALWHEERLLNIRAGRMYIPFGEEYQTRYAIDNPLITHSVSDIWGVDEGVELYGSKGPFRYAVAVQNGGHPLLRDYNSDKSVAGRLSYAPTAWLNLSASGMRTGDLSAANDKLSGVWFANGFFRPIGSSQVTTFHADLAEADAQAHWRQTVLKAAGGYARYGDNDQPASNSRNLYYYYAEAVQGLTDKIFGAARFSEVVAPQGYPLTGLGDYGEYFLDNSSMTKSLWRLSLGLSYRWSRDLIFKTEYSFENGRLMDGSKRDHENLLGAEVAVRF